MLVALRAGASVDTAACNWLQGGDQSRRDRWMNWIPTLEVRWATDVAHTVGDCVQGERVIQYRWRHPLPETSAADNCIGAMLRAELEEDDPPVPAQYVQLPQMSVRCLMCRYARLCTLQ